MSHPGDQHETAATQLATPAPQRRARRWVTRLLAVAVGLLVALSGGLAYAVAKHDGTTAPVAKPWQAVFLTSGQVYFGRVASTTVHTVVLRDVYYLQVEQPLQPAPADQGAAQSAAQSISLAKLGRSELHCPVDEMDINRDQVLFTERLRSESKVVRAITEFVRDNGRQTACYSGERQSQAAAPTTTTTP